MSASLFATGMSMVISLCVSVGSISSKLVSHNLNNVHQLRLCSTNCGAGELPGSLSRPETLDEHQVLQEEDLDAVRDRIPCNNQLLHDGCTAALSPVRSPWWFPRDAPGLLPRLEPPEVLARAPHVGRIYLDPCHDQELLGIPAKLQVSGI